MSLQDVLQTLRDSRVPGRRTLPNGTELIGRVPHVAPQAWFHKIYGPLSEEGTAKIERILKKTLPTILKRFFTLANGLNMYSDELAIYGLRSDYSRTGDAAIQPYHIQDRDVLERPRDAAPALIFIGGYSADGSLVYIDCGTQRVFRCTRESSKPLNEWPHFVDFLTQEVERLSGLFDADGRAVNPSAPTTPNSR